MTATPTTLPPPAVSTSTVAVASTSSQRAQLADRLVAQLIDKFAQLLPPGARPIAQGPIRNTDLPRAAGPINLVQAARWYTVSQQQDATLAYVAARTPPGFITNTPSGGESWGGEIGGPHPYIDSAYRGQETETYDTPIVTVLATSENGHTSVWIDAYTTWRPVRTPAEFVATNVSGATAVSAPGGDYLGAAMHLDQTQAQRVAGLLNALDTVRPSALPCMPGSMYTVTFDGTGQTFDIGGCAEVTVRTGNTQQPALADDAPFDQRSVLDAELDTIFGREVGCSSVDIILPNSCPTTFFSSTG
ncbi:MAG TPA: hypothetical protein VIJ96_06995 [Acidothermaceae bacterium]